MNFAHHAFASNPGIVKTPALQELFQVVRVRSRR